MIVLDASVLIAHFDHRDAHHDRATAALIASATEGFAASAVTVAEVLVGPARRGREQAMVDALARTGLRTVPVDGEAPVELARLRARTGLKLPDCSVLLAARGAGGAVASFDHRLTAAAEGLGLRVLPI